MCDLCPYIRSFKNLHALFCKVLLWLFCYRSFVWPSCCIAELICNKMRSSEINLYYSEMQLELSEIDLNYMKFIWKLLKLT